MKTLEQEAEEYKKSITYSKDLPQILHDLAARDFIAGATSEYVKKQTIQAQIDALEEVLDFKEVLGAKQNVRNRGFFSPNKGTITEVIRKQVDFGNGCPEPFSSIREIVLR